MRKYLHQTLQLERYAILSLIPIGAHLQPQVICVHTTKRNRSGASGPAAEKDLLELTIANATSSFTSTIDPTSVKVAASHSRGWTDSTGIVSLLSILPSASPLILPSALRGRGGLSRGSRRGPSQRYGQFYKLDDVWPSGLCWQLCGDGAQ